MSVIKQSISSTQFMIDHGDPCDVDSKVRQDGREEVSQDGSKQVFNNSQSMLLDNYEQHDSHIHQQDSITKGQKQESMEKQVQSQFKDKSKKQQNILIISQFTNQYTEDPQHQIKYLTNQLAYYEQKYLKYKNITARQQDVIIKLVGELKQTREALKYHKEVIPAQLQAYSKSNELELVRLREEIGNKEKIIKKMEKKLNQRMKVSQIVIEEIYQPNQKHEKKLQNLLCEQQKLLQKSNEKIEALTEELYELSVSAIQQQSQLNHLKSIILSLEHENNCLFHQKQQQILKNERMKMMIEVEEKKIQELGECILQLTSSTGKKKHKQIHTVNQQIGSNSTIRVGQ